MESPTAGIAAAWIILPIRLYSGALRHVIISSRDYSTMVSLVVVHLRPDSVVTATCLWKPEQLGYGKGATGQGIRQS